MKTKAFVLGMAAMVTVVAGVMAGGCSGQLDNPVVAADASADAVVSDARQQSDAISASFDGAGGTTTCEPVDATKFPYTKALVAPGSCTDDELKAISDFFKAKSDANEDVLASEWSAVVSATCAGCVFSDGKGATWTPIVVKNDKLEDVNRGGCIEIVSGSEACGRAYQQMWGCKIEACTRPCPLGTDVVKCFEDPAPGRCKTAYFALTGACGANVASYEAQCKGTSWTFEGPIRVQCITGGPGDGG